MDVDAHADFLADRQEAPPQIHVLDRASVAVLPSIAASGRRQSMALVHVLRVGEDDDPLDSELSGVFRRAFERSDACGKLHPLVRCFVEAGVEDVLVGPVKPLGKWATHAYAPVPPGLP
jgi:hypothetical protein